MMRSRLRRRIGLVLFKEPTMLFEIMVVISYRTLVGNWILVSLELRLRLVLLYAQIVEYL